VAILAVVVGREAWLAWQCLYVYLWWCGFVKSAYAASAAASDARRGRGGGGILDVAVDVPGRRVVLRRRAGEIERARAEVGGGGAAGVRAFVFRLAEGLVDGTQTAKRHVGERVAMRLGAECRSGGRD
jgi:hypothetical protein